jgi:hypothetical protein
MVTPRHAVILILMSGKSVFSIFSQIGRQFFTAFALPYLDTTKLIKLVSLFHILAVSYDSNPFSPSRFKYVGPTEFQRLSNKAASTSLANVRIETFVNSCFSDSIDIIPN